MTPRVHGRRWQIHHEDREGLYGECDWSARTITIPTSLKNCRRQFRLEILLHEVLHALFPDATEEQVDEAGKVLSKIVWADGWRRLDARKRK